jgi:hypothetical protein
MFTLALEAHDPHAENARSRVPELFLHIDAAGERG